MSRSSVRVPMSMYILAGRDKPNDEQAKFLLGTEVVGGPLDGLAVQMPNVVDWSRSEPDLSPLVPWLGNPDPTWPRRLLKELVVNWPDLQGRLDVIRVNVEIIGDGYKWGDLLPIRAV